MDNHIEYRNVQFNVNGIDVIIYGHITCISSNDVYVLEDIVATFIEIISNKGILCDEILFWGDIIINKQIVKQPRFFAIYSEDTESYLLGEIGKIRGKDIPVENLGKNLNYDEIIGRLESVCHGITDGMEYEPEELYDDSGIYNNFNNDMYDDINGDMHGNINGDMEGDINGNMYGNINGDMHGDINGNMHGNINGDMEGDINGDMKGDINGDMEGDINGDMYGNINGDMKGDINGNMYGDWINGDMEGDINGDMYCCVRGQMKGNVYGQIK